MARSGGWSPSWIGYLLLHLHGTAHRSVDAVEHHEQGIAPGVDDPAAMLLDRWVDQVFAESPQPFERPNIVQADQAAVAHHVGMDDGDQLPPIWRLFRLGPMRWSPDMMNGPANRSRRYHRKLNSGEDGQT